MDTYKVFPWIRKEREREREAHMNKKKCVCPQLGTFLKYAPGA